MPNHDTATRTGAGEALRLLDVTKTYGVPGNHITALDNVNLVLPTGSFTAVMGPSGSGKSTLLHCAAGLDTPDSGHVCIDGAELKAGNETETTKFRRQRVGFIFQQFNLLPTMTVLQNVTLPLRLAGRKIDRGHCEHVLRQVGLADRMEHRPAELSGGQQQRVAIARALATSPSVVFADEPTGALDTRSAREVLALLAEAVHAFGQTVVMVTHDPVAASYADSVVFLSDGRVVDWASKPSAETVAAKLTHLGDDVAARRHAAAGA